MRSCAQQGYKKNAPTSSINTGRDSNPTTKQIGGMWVL